MIDAEDEGIPLPITPALLALLPLPPNVSFPDITHFMLTLFKSHIRPLIEFGSPLWNTGYITDLRLLESVQRRWTKRIEGMSELPYSERLAALDLYSVKGRLLRADLIKCWAIFHNNSCIHPEDLFVLAPVTGTRGHRFKLAHSYSSLECRKRFFSLRCTNVWNSLPDSVVALESVNAFKAALHTTLGSLLFEYIE